MPTREPQRRFASLLHEHRKVVFKVAGLYSRSAADRDDLVQKNSARVNHVATKISRIKRLADDMSGRSLLRASHQLNESARLEHE